LKQIGIADINRSLTLTLSSQNAYKPGTDIEFDIHNMSPYEVLLPADYGAKIFMARDTGWLELKNNLEYHGEVELLSAASGPLLSEFPAIVRPAFGPDVNLQPQNIVRILVAGELMNGQAKPVSQVGAYVDIILTR